VLSASAGASAAVSSALASSAGASSAFFAAFFLVVASVLGSECSSFRAASNSAALSAFGSGCLRVLVPPMSPVILSSAATASVGWAPTPSQYWARSETTWIVDGSVCGLYWPIVSLVAPTATWRQSKAIPWGGDYVGPAGAMEFFTRLNEGAETTAFTPKEIIECGSDVFTFGNYGCTVRATGKPASMDWMFRWRVENGRITMFDSYVDSAAIVLAMN